MRTRVGLWIDHRKAIIVTVTDKGEDMGHTPTASRLYDLIWERLKKGNAMRVAVEAERDAAKDTIAKLESKVDRMGKETLQLKRMVDELSGGLGA